MKDPLDIIESRLQTLIEGSISRLMLWDQPQQRLAHLLVEAMRAGLNHDTAGQVYAPNLYTVRINPVYGPSTLENRDLLEELGREIYQAGSEAGFMFPGSPRISLILDESIPVENLVVNALVGPQDLSETTSLLVDQENAGSPDLIPQNAFLIINGNQTYPLNLPVVNVGRRPDNHLVLDDPRISRNHIQLRAIKGRYMLFDLNSTGGTQVNGERVVQHRLSPGDVISLAGFPLIYGQDVPVPRTRPSK